ncbi:MAG: hypothetical protein P4L96_13160 [Rhodoferax sp.]|nr:hypothetical protein [Rhodoferax sp.]
MTEHMAAIAHALLASECVRIRLSEIIDMTESTGQKSILGAIAFSVAGLPLLVIGSDLLFLTLSSRLTNSGRVATTAFCIGAFSTIGGLLCLKRAWSYAAGTARTLTIKTTGPVGKTIGIAALAGKGLTDLQKIHLQFFSTHGWLIPAALGSLVMAPIVVWGWQRFRKSAASASVD